jgi:guanine nucleotide-binding protein subunit alpha
MYKPNSIEQERASWRTVIYFNVVHSLKHILTTLEAWDDSFEDDPRAPQPTGYYDQASSSSQIPPVPTAPSRAESPAFGGRNNRIVSLRNRLTPLLATDAPLADRLSGGITVSGSGKGGVFVRSGWQARTIDKALSKGLKKASNESRGREGYIHEDDGDILLQDVGRMLSALKDDVRELWAHPTVKGLIMKRKLKLDEWSELYVFVFLAYRPYLTTLFSFLKDITRIAAPEYVPTTGLYSFLPEKTRIYSSLSVSRRHPPCPHPDHGSRGAYIRRGPPWQVGHLASVRRRRRQGPAAFLGEYSPFCVFIVL